MKRITMRMGLAAALLGVVFLIGPAVVAADTNLLGSVQIAGKPVSEATVTIYAAGAVASAKLAEGKSVDDGSFKLTAKELPKDSIIYVIAKGGTPKGAEGKKGNGQMALLSVLGTNTPKTVVINELTTVASTFTAARFVNGESHLRQSARIADRRRERAEPGGSGDRWVGQGDPRSAQQHADHGAREPEYARRRLSAPSPPPPTTPGAPASSRRRRRPAGSSPRRLSKRSQAIARRPWANAKELYALFDEAYPQPKDGSRRKAPFVPYLAWSPPDFMLSLCFAGGGMCANGRFMFDAEGNLWSGQNWMPGSQSGVIKSIGGGVIKLLPEWQATFTAHHRLYRHGPRWRRLGHRRHPRARLGHELQRQDSRHGFQRPPDRQGG